MAVVAVIHGQLRFLRAMLADSTYFCHLFKNDRRPAHSDSVLQYVEADFDGYGGPQEITNWTEPTMVDGRAHAKADALSWVQNGGPIDNLIFGYYVTDAEGLLVWVERNAVGPRVVSASAPDYVVKPILTETSEF